MRCKYRYKYSYKYRYKCRYKYRFKYRYTYRYEYRYTVYLYSTLWAIYIYICFPVYIYLQYKRAYLCATADCLDRSR